MKKLRNTIYTLGIIAACIIAGGSYAEAYTRLDSGSVWNMSKLLEQYGSPNYSCKNVSCQNDNSDSVKDANRTNRNPYVRFMCVQRPSGKKVCQDRIHTQLKDVKDFIGPGTRLGNAFIPSVTSFKVFNSSGQDITYASCAQPGESLNFVISSEHRTCGTRALITHYNIRFADQEGHSSRRGDIGGRTVHNMTGGFTFIAPLEEGIHLADIATINPIAPWLRNRGDGKSRVDYLLENAMSGYYTYEIGNHAVRVCAVDDSFRVSCVASPLQVRPGDSITFTANAANGVGPYTYEWGDGSVGRTKTVSYSDIGSKAQRIKVTDSAGNIQQATCYGTVTNAPFDDAIDIGDGSSVWRFDSDGNLIDDAEIVKFGADRMLTNNTCTFEWETSGMARCRIISATGQLRDVETTGTVDLPGGTYTLECTSASTYQVHKSQPVRCLKNPDIREF